MFKNKFNSFSVPLGLLDYINPIFYSITTIILSIKLYNVIPFYLYMCFVLGAIISLIFGFTIPTVKVLVGLKKFKFKMPVNLVFLVNLGIIISGLSLFFSIFKIKLIYNLLVFFLFFIIVLSIYFKVKKFNTIAVLLGAVGYIFIYSSLIKISIIKKEILPIIFCVLAILFFLSLCTIGITSNLKNPKIHWVIEISNVLCQAMVSLATYLLFF